MATVKTVWGIDIGQCALKALKLRSVEGELRVEAFDVIDHPKILTQPDVDRDQLIRNALEQFLARNNVQGSVVVVSAPGQSGLTKFVKLPPVESKQVPEIVRFEAEQQIPFDINEVIWRWQAFQDPDSPDIEVGIFAIRRVDIASVLDRFNDVGIQVDQVQMAPLALYNFMDYDGQTEPEGATLLVDVGADKTDLVVADGPRIWTRTLQLGGNNFTEALVKAFKLSFSKAEKLKRSAATSKYARQIFQAMRPVFAELVQEIQRSIGYYTSLHRESRFRKVLGLGNGFRLPGLQKFLEQNLGISVVRVDTYDKLSPSPAVNAPAFTENVLSFAVAYGLALQGLGLTKIRTNLLPAEISRQRRWAKKRPWFAAAAVVLSAALGGMAWRSYADRNALDPQRESARPFHQAASILKQYQALKQQLPAKQARPKAEEQRIQQYQAMLAYRNCWPTLHYMVNEAILSVARDQGLMRWETVKQFKKIPRPKRRVVVVDSLVAEYVEDAESLDENALKQRRGGGRGFLPSAGPPRPMGRREGGAPMPPPMAGGAPMAPRMPGPGGSPMSPRMPAGPAVPPIPGRAGVSAVPGVPGAAPAAPSGKPGFLLFLDGSTPQRTQGGDAHRFLNEIKNALINVSKTIPTFDVKIGRPIVVTPGKEPTEAAGTPAAPAGIPGAAQSAVHVDPLTGEDTSMDTTFTLGWIVILNDDGLPKPAKKPPVGGATGGAP